jgi:HD-GYP domain-containing protein (c-di-GMP phosphodiesterase class II)
MISTAADARRVDDLLRRFASALRAAQLYSATHPLVGRNLALFHEAVGHHLSSNPSLTFAIVGDEIVVGDTPVPKAVSTMGDLMRRLKAHGVERVTLARGVTEDEIGTLIQLLNRTMKGAATLSELADEEESGALPHVRVGRVEVQEQIETSLSDMATIRRLYADAVAAASRIWHTVLAGNHPDTTEVRGVVNSLAHAVAQNRTALMALTALKSFDNYSFTHMVNVSILTMAQAHALGIEGALLHEFGLAALMHDIGKVRTPPEILLKPDKLTDEEFAIVRRHPLDGAEILRQTPDVPPLVPIVAFEHHLRLNGSGYPLGVSRPSLNLATMMCSVADVYDAMRTERRYQHAFAIDRILEVLENNDGSEFEPNLVRRFVQLVGLYPAGSLVRLNTGAIAVVTKPCQHDPHRPSVRVVREAGLLGCGVPYDLDLWEADQIAGKLVWISSPVEPEDLGIDPLDYL